MSTSTERAAKNRARRTSLAAAAADVARAEQPMTVKMTVDGLRRAAASIEYDAKRLRDLADAISEAGGCSAAVVLDAVTSVMNTSSHISALQTAVSSAYRFEAEQVVEPVVEGRTVRIGHRFYDVITLPDGSTTTVAR